MSAVGEIDALLAQARQALQGGDARSATDLLYRLLDRHPGEARALNLLGNQALRAGDPAAARTFFERAAATDPSPPVLLNLAIAHGALGDRLRELATIDAALTADPYFQPALFRRALWMEQHGDRAAVIVAYRALIATLPPGAQLPEPMRVAVARGEALIAEDGALLAGRLATVFDDTPPAPRVGECIDILLGRKRVYVPQPSGMHFPFLPAVPFFDRALFPWFERLEAATDLLAHELRDMLAEDAGIEPYVAFQPGQPVNQWAALNHSRDWSAFFLWRDGVPVQENLVRCPGTAKVLATLPMLDLPGRGPTAMFSILQPHTAIPPHTGVTNIRSVVHLPLVVPPGCGFRVGGETRAWRVGEAWAFDDSIEHEAWNDSSEPRAILIVDAWNPYLTADERAQLARVTQVTDEHARAG